MQSIMQLFGQLGHRPRLPIFWQIFLPVLLVLLATFAAAKAYVDQQQLLAVKAIVEHEEIDLKDEVEGALRQLSDVYVGLYSTLRPLVTEPATSGSQRLEQSLDDLAERKEGVPCVYAAVISLAEPSQARRIEPWIDSQVGWRLESHVSSAAVTQLLSQLRNGNVRQLLLSPPEHALLSDVSADAKGSAQGIKGAVIWAVAELETRSDSGEREAVVAAFDVRKALTHFFYSPRHLSWMVTPLGNVHGMPESEVPALFRDEQLQQWRSAAQVAAHKNPVYRELVRHKAVEDCGPTSGLGELWYCQSRPVSDGTALAIPVDDWRRWQSRHCEAGEGLSGATIELPRYRVSARSKNRLEEFQSQIQATLQKNQSVEVLHWERPLQLVGGDSQLGDNSCVIEYVHFTPPRFVLPAENWDLAVGMFKQEVGEDAYREISGRYWWFLSAVPIGLLGTGLLVWLITESIRRIKTAAILIATKAETNSPDWLDELPELPVDREDEVGDLARAFAAMVGSIGSRDTALRDEHTRTQAILENAADGILTVDHTHAIIDCNRAAARLFRWDQGSARGRKIEEVVVDPANVQLDELSPSDSGIFGRRLTNVLAIRSDGARFPMDLTISQVPLDADNIELIIVRDVSEREGSAQRQRELYAELEASKQELEDRVARRTKELATAKDDVERRNAELVRINGIRAEGLRSIAHELVSPLSGIMSQASTLMRSSTPLTPEQTSKLKKIQRAGRHVVGIIDALRTMARCESGRIELAFGKVSLRECLQDVGDVLEPLFEARKIELVRHFVDSSVEIIADEAALRQVFVNLLSNACKYSPEERSVAVYLDDDGAFASVRVVDHGIGIPPDDLPHIFEDFRRASNANVQAVGLGLGLSIAQKLVQRHTESISVQSELGVGTTFTVRLPHNPTPAVDDGSSSQTLETLESHWLGRRVLVVDHQDSRMAALKEIFESLGTVVVCAATAEQAIAEAEVLKPEVAFVADRRLDRPLGEVLSLLRDLPGVEPPIVVLITALNEVYAERQCREQHCDGFVRVPLSRAAVVNTVREFRKRLTIAPPQVRGS